MDARLMIQKALDMRKLSYAPYSGFAVGACLKVKDEDIYFTGCNIENASYPVSVCAERTALGKAVSEGYREFEAIAVAGGPAGEAELSMCPPCGMCRQALAEFAVPGSFKVILAQTGKDGEICEIRELTLEELLPGSFSSENMK